MHRRGRQAGSERRRSTRVRLIGRTEFLPPDDVPWTTDATGGQALAEFAGRACYQSWSKPIPATATNAGYLDHILQVGHLSVLEHSTATFYITGISRSVTHELIRHRHFSYSQLSQRYLPATGPEVVEPAVIAADPALHDIFAAAAATVGRRVRGAAVGAGGAGRRRARRHAGPQAGPAGRPGGAAERHQHARSWSLATTGPGGISSGCGPPRPPTWTSGAWRSRSLWSCKPWRPTFLPIFGSADSPTAQR